jgi:hypothetical protein
MHQTLCANSQPKICQQFINKCASEANMQQEKIPIAIINWEFIAKEVHNSHVGIVEQCARQYYNEPNANAKPLVFLKCMETSYPSSFKNAQTEKA